MATLVGPSGVRRIILLTLGWEELPKSVSVHGAPAEERMREPVPGVLLQTDGGWVMLDTGFNTALVRDPYLYRRFFPTVEYRPVLPGPGEPIEQRLAEVGVDIDQIHTVAVSHLHHDHAGGIKLFADKVPVHAQRRELEYGLSNHPEPERNAIVRVDFDDPRIDWCLADGEAEIAPGVTAVPTYGHTPGHQSFVVQLDHSVSGGDEAANGYVFAFDAADLTENIEHELAIGGFIDVTAEETVEPIRKLKKLAADKGFPLIPGHDPHVWPELTQHFHERFGPVSP
jgi:glyoxylase-like metal-dependent hydrolase (beta-lactamase superfamily II)